MLTQLQREMGRLLGCIGCFCQGADHILAQLGRGMGRLLGCIWRGPNHILTQLGREMGRFPWLQRLLFSGHRSYPHPIEEKNGKALAVFSRAQIISSPN